MIAIIRQGTSKEQIEKLTHWIEAQGLSVHLSSGEFTTIVGLIGDTSKIDEDLLRSLDIVEAVRRISEPFKSANRKFHPEDSVINVDNTSVGGDIFAVMAGPCSVESKEQVIEIAKAVKAAGATMLRGGAFKPRTSPYDFQGLKAEGIEYLLAAKKETGLPIVTEIMSASHLDLFSDVDVIQVGARNMQNFELLKELGRTQKPILLKRGLSATIKEWLMSAEYIMAGGNENVILCERGIRTFETYTRNTLDLSVIPVVKKLSHLPIIIDPSHATGRWDLVESMSLAAICAGCDGLLIEVHNNPSKALSDGSQALTFKKFNKLMKNAKKVAKVVKRKICS